MTATRRRHAQPARPIARPGNLSETGKTALRRAARPSPRHPIGPIFRP